jgi:hypothetical protein
LAFFAPRGGPPFSANFSSGRFIRKFTTEKDHLPALRLAGLHGNRLRSQFRDAEPGLSRGQFLMSPRTGRSVEQHALRQSQILSRISPVSKYYQDTFYPLPNNADRFNEIYVFPNSSDQHTIRTDHKISNANSIFGRFMYQTYQYSRYDGETNPNIGMYDQWRDQFVVVISDTHVVSPSVVNDASAMPGRRLYRTAARSRCVRAAGLNLRDLQIRALPRVHRLRPSTGVRMAGPGQLLHNRESLVDEETQPIRFRQGYFNGRQCDFPSQVFGRYSSSDSFREPMRTSWGMESTHARRR